MLASKRPTTLICALAALMAAGCGSDSKKSTRAQSAAGATAPGATPGTPGTSGTPRTPGAAGITATSSALQAPVANLADAPFVALALTFEATGTGQQRIDQLDLASAGSIDETTIGGLELIEDLNGNGVIDQGETSVASAPVALTDNGAYQIQPASPIVLAPGTPRSFLVTFDMTAAAVADQTAAVGDTVDLSITDALSIQGTDDQGNASTINGTFPIGGTPVTLELNDTVLISELCVGPGSGNTAAEFIEIFNATATAVDLSDYYVTDVTHAPTNGIFYWKLPSGQDFHNGFTSDFVVRFPNGATIAPGQIMTVAIDAGGFNAAYGSDATFCLRNRGSTTSMQMLVWDGVTGGTNFVAQDAHISAGLTGSSTTTSTGESVFIFAWDGTQDLVVDVDLINYGGSSSTNTAVDKTPGQTAPGAPDVKIDSISDADTVESTFQPDQTEFFQFDNRAPNHVVGGSITRIDFTEGTEIKTGGNGLTGNDETSEEFGDGIGGNGTFEANATATPGTIQ